MSQNPFAILQDYQEEAPVEQREKLQRKAKKTDRKPSAPEGAKTEKRAGRGPANWGNPLDDAKRVVPEAEPKPEAAAADAANDAEPKAEGTEEVVDAPQAEPEKPKPPPIPASNFFESDSDEEAAPEVVSTKAAKETALLAEFAGLAQGPKKQKAKAREEVEDDDVELGFLSTVEAEKARQVEREKHMAARMARQQGPDQKPWLRGPRKEGEGGAPQEGEGQRGPFRGGRGGYPRGGEGGFRSGDRPEGEGGERGGRGGGRGGWRGGGRGEGGDRPEGEGQYRGGGVYRGKPQGEGQEGGSQEGGSYRGGRGGPKPGGRVPRDQQPHNTQYQRGARLGLDQFPKLG